jgi:hypothetical protein
MNTMTPAEMRRAAKELRGNARVARVSAREFFETAETLDDFAAKLDLAALNAESEASKGE